MHPSESANIGYQHQHCKTISTVYCIYCPADLTVCVIDLPTESHLTAFRECENHVKYFLVSEEDSDFLVNRYLNCEIPCKLL
jgi:hypothetical protein